MYNKIGDVFKIKINYYLQRKNVFTIGLVRETVIKVRQIARLQKIILFTLN